MWALLMAAAPALAQAPGPEPQDENRWERRERLRRMERLERRERLERIRLGRADGVHLRILNNYFLAEGATATEPVVVIGGSARIDGHLEEDVVVIGGGLRLGPRAVVDGNVVTVGGELSMEPGAAVRGTIDEASIPWPTIDIDPWSTGWGIRPGWPALALWGSVFRIAFILVVCSFLTLVAPGWISRIAGRPAASSGLLGAVVELLFVPALILLVVMLVVSIIGIPLLTAIPFLLAAFGVLWVAGFTGVAVRLGRALRGRADPDASISDFLVGYGAIVSVTLGAHVLALALGWAGPVAWPFRITGLLIEYLAWTIGLGAAVTSMFASRRVVPPPLAAPSGL
jgi:hypothetical protein